VLAIAAAKLGFDPVAAVDVESAAVEAARANAAANGVSVEVRRADVYSRAFPHADVAVANIALEAVERLGAHVRSPALVSSGYLERDEPRPAAYRHVERRTMDRWAADLFARE
jgi:ribosomal protein L11 methyltransferase